MLIESDRRKRTTGLINGRTVTQTESYTITHALNQPVPIRQSTPTGCRISPPTYDGLSPVLLLGGRDNFN
jgi:hypothetical protein